MNASIEVPFVSERTAERLLSRAREAESDRLTAFQARGMRAARARDPKLLKVVEKALELADATNERQNGQTQRASSTPLGFRYAPMTLQLIRNAYEALDKYVPGSPDETIMPFVWYYGAAAELAFGG